MKGKDTFSQEDFDELIALIRERSNVPSRQQKKLRDRMRNMGFYGRDDWGITDCKVEDILQLVKTGHIRILDEKAVKLIGEKELKKHSSHDLIIKKEADFFIDFSDIDNIRQAGFRGFIPVESLFQNSNQIPDCKGVYIVLRKESSLPIFKEKGSGGYLKGKDPNVSIETLKEKWVHNSHVLYIGKAGGKIGNKPSRSTLRKRIAAYLKFGKGLDVGHWGGRYIWQLSDAKELLVCWKTLDLDEPSVIESTLVSVFKQQYGGKRPFANLKL